MYSHFIRKQNGYGHGHGHGAIVVKAYKYMLKLTFRQADENRHTKHQPITYIYVLCCVLTQCTQ